MENIRKIFVEKKSGFDVEAKKIFNDIQFNLKIKGLKNVRVLNKYLISNIDDKTFEKSLTTVFSEPPVDSIYFDKFETNKSDLFFGMKLLPGQFDQRSDSATQCIKLINPKAETLVYFSRVIILEGNVEKKEFEKIKNYLINPIESHEIDVDSTAVSKSVENKNIFDVSVKNFGKYDKQELQKFYEKNRLAMSFDDITLVSKYFKKIGRDPTMTEIKVIDTYWSDHCRHTTFESRIESVKIESSKYTVPIKNSFKAYVKLRESLFGHKSERKMSLMDLATICAKEMKKHGHLSDLDISDEINACSINIDVDIDGKIEKYLLMFKNETHNHPTEIEPFGGASTCLGGAIRDPLSGRTYVYQAMRVTGSGDPTKPISETLPNKLPQKNITTVAADGYASYGNQIGLATGQVDEIYHEGYIAKRMEVGAVIAAAPKKNVVRKKLYPGDVVLLVGGETGKDGVGGATGSSKKHSKNSAIESGAEVQKGNAVCERKIQRLFKRREVAKLIKKCNDFGAGGVAVAVGELAPGLKIFLDRVPLKYPSLNVTEIALSESQERMAVVVSRANVCKFIRYAKQENLMATKIAFVSRQKKLQMFWNKKLVVDIERDFLDTNGVEQKVKVSIKAPIVTKPKTKIKSFEQKFEEMLVDLNCCSKLGMIQKFDSTIGKNTILMPLGGKYQMTPAEGMVAKIPTFGKETNTVSIMSYGFNPYIGEWSPYHMGYYSIVESITKVIAMGGRINKIRLTFQEYFEKLGSDSSKWGKPFAALLGAFEVQTSLKLAAIGGKDSMSGTYEKINVPPTLISFAVATGDANNIISPEFKKLGSTVALIDTKKNGDGTIDLNEFKEAMIKIHKFICSKKIISAFSLKHKGIAEAVTKMSLGNRIGINFEENISVKQLFEQNYGSMVVEISPDCNSNDVLKELRNIIIGKTISQPTIQYKTHHFKIEEIEKKTLSKLENVFRFDSKEPDANVKIKITKSTQQTLSSKKYVRKPLVVIPVFPGTNCEFDSQSSWEKAGARVKQVLIRNLTTKMLKQSIRKLVQTIKKANIIMIPGGFSGGDEPDGSAKFIVNVFQNPSVKKATMNLLNKRDGLMIGICNGFQALVKLGLLPYGEIKETNSSMPTLTYNTINHHMSQLVRTKIVSNKSPWLAGTKVNDIYTLPISHGEGKFYASEEIIKKLEKNGQIVAQYVDLENQPTMKMPHNPNGSVYAIESITSLDGRILGKMAHSERIGDNLYKNVPGVFDQKLFENGVKYFHRGK